MKQANHQKTQSTTEETPSNNRDTGKKDSEVYCPKGAIVFSEQLVQKPVNYQFKLYIEGV
jgi:hypothetical protein